MIEYLKIFNREIIINLFFNLSNNFIGLIIPIFVQFHIVRILDFENLGEINTLLAIQSWILLFVTSSHWVLISKISRSNNLKSLSYLISNYLVYSYIIICFLSIALVIYSTFFTKWNPILINFTIIGIFFGALGSDFYHQALLKNKIIFFRKLILKILFLVVVLLIIRDKSDYILYFSLIVLSIVLESVISFLSVSKFFTLKLFRKKILYKFTYTSFDLVLFTVSYSILPTLLVFVLPFYFSSFQIGVYTTLIKLFTLLTGFITSIAIVFLPNSIKSTKNNYDAYFINTLYFTSILAVFVGVLTFLFKPIVIYLFLNNNDISLLDYIYLIFYMISHSVFNHFVFNYYIRNKKYKFLILFNLFVLLIFILTVCFFGYGLPFSSALFYPTIIGLIVLFFYYKKMKIKLISNFFEYEK